MPKKRTKEYAKLTKLLKDSASPQKMEWMYVSKLVMAIMTFVISIFIFNYIHKVSTNWVYEEILLEDGSTSMMMSSAEQKKGERILEADNIVLNKLKNNRNATKEDVRLHLAITDYYRDADDETLDIAKKDVIKIKSNYCRKSNTMV